MDMSVDDLSYDLPLSLPFCPSEDSEPIDIVQLT